MSANATPSIRYRVTLKPGRERSLLRHHPWVYSGSVDEVAGLAGAEPGDLGQVFSSAGELFGVAMVNPAAALVARMLRFDDGPIDATWMQARLARAVALRRAVVPPRTTAYRLINAEGDGLPGLIVDCYGEHLVVQCLTCGMGRLEALWLPALIECFSPRTILERGAAARHEAGFERTDRLIHGVGTPEPFVILESGVSYRVDVAQGQKTGLYLDQRDNRDLIGKLAAGRAALDAFAYTGGFAVRMGLGSALRVTAVESSATALRAAADNWRLNDLEPDRFAPVRANVADFLRADTTLFDLIVLDPPPFARDRSHVERASRAYKDVNLRALKRLAPGGWLATFSCSQHVGVDLFQKIVFAAALDAGVPLAWVRRLGAAADHPVHLDHPQGEYLTGLLLRSLA